MKDLLLWEEEESYREADAPDEPRTDAEEDALYDKRERLRARARKELDWFYGALGGRVPEEGTGEERARLRAAVIDQNLKAISAFHRGALALRFTPREWPRSLAERYGEWTSLVVRLDCVLHPSGGGKTTEELEKAAVERLEKRPEDGDELLSRAEAHEHLAIRAYLKVRGEGHLVPPLRRGNS